MGIFIIIAIAYLPIIYRINKRLNKLERDVRELKGEDNFY